MSRLANYVDVSEGGDGIRAAFQFEFSCRSCGRKWRSPKKQYRRGQLAGLFHMFYYFFGSDAASLGRSTSNVASLGARGARETALREAIELAEQRYVICPNCDKEVCEDCWDAGRSLCHTCLRKGAGAPQQQAGSAGSVATAALRCPNCSSEASGGRFCPECGFDMASTHKSCPSCGAMCARSTRFCTDCGHAF